MKSVVLSFFLVLVIASTGQCKRPVKHPVKHRHPAPAIMLGDKSFAISKYYIDIAVADSPKMVSQIIQNDPKVVFAVNGGYFNRSKLYMIGQISRKGIDLTEYSLSANRGTLFQGIDLGMGWHAPEYTFCSIDAGPYLMRNGCIVKVGWQGFKPYHWSEVTIRNIVATKGGYVHFLRLRGSLWACQIYLKKYGFKDAINLDGGSSCYPWAKVRNAVVVKKKTEKDYQDFQKGLLLSKIGDLSIFPTGSLPGSLDQKK